jgi:hypothetical protein
MIGNNNTRAGEQANERTGADTQRRKEERRASREREKRCCVRRCCRMTVPLPRRRLLRRFHSPREFQGKLFRAKMGRHLGEIILDTVGVEKKTSRRSVLDICRSPYGAAKLLQGIFVFAGEFLVCYWSIATLTLTASIECQFSPRSLLIRRFVVRVASRPPSIL